jgi:hypothetical protein
LEETGAGWDFEAPGAPLLGVNFAGGFDLMAEAIEAGRGFVAVEIEAVFKTLALPGGWLSGLGGRRNSSSAFRFGPRAELPF